MRMQTIHRTGSTYGATNWGALPIPAPGVIKVIPGTGPMGSGLSNTWTGVLAQRDLAMWPAAAIPAGLSDMVVKTGNCAAGCTGCAPCRSRRPGRSMRTRGTTSFSAVEAALDDIQTVATDPTAKRPMSGVTVAAIALAVVLLFGR